MLAFVLLSAHGPVAARQQASVPAKRPVGPLGARVIDGARRIDANRINLFTTNMGSFAFDIQNQDAGLYWPRGTTTSAVFASGLWLGGTVNGQVRLALAEYSTEYRPGRMNANGTPDDPNRPEYIVYKVVRLTDVRNVAGQLVDTLRLNRTPEELATDPFMDPIAHHSWAEYRRAIPFGAPSRLHRLPVTNTPAPDDSVDILGPDVLGDQMLWCVYNDADPGDHNNDAGSTLPLGIEVSQTMFAFDRPDELGDVVYLRFVIANKGVNTINDFHLSLWCDPDLGGAAGFTDDLVGCDSTRSLGFTYNFNQTDGGYGTPPPAVGYALLRGPAFPPGSTPLGMTAFSKFINGTDPQNAIQTYNYMQGLYPDGTPIVDPFGVLTWFMVAGDPVTGTGWLDSAPSDRRFLMSSGSGAFAPGQTQELWAAIVMARGADRLASVATLRCAADLARSAFDQGFSVPLPTQDVSCSSAAGAIANCPRPAAFWGSECAAGGTGQLSVAQLGAVANAVDARSAYFQWAAGPRASLCATISPGAAPDLRQQARQEFATFLANYAGNEVSLPVGGTDRIFLDPSTPVSCPPLTATSIQELAATGVTEPSLSASYLNLDATHRRALGEVNWGGGAFNGGAGFGYNFFGGTLDPLAVPVDSFTTVEYRFNGTQKAYRFLRLERADGTPPVTGRGYLYGGYRDVPFQLWDATHNRQLEAAFVERCVAAADGTILGPASQPASFDSTWAPDASPEGGREYLFALSYAYAGVAKPEIGHDGAIADDSQPLMFALWSRLRSEADVIDPGDAFQFLWGKIPSPGADQLLLDLEPYPLDDPQVQQQYQQLIDCLSAINSGVGIGPVCTSVPTAALVSLVEAHAERDRVTLRWYSDAIASATVERRAEGGEWRALGRISPDGTRQLVFVDRNVVPGHAYDYRLAVQTQDGIRYFGEARVEIALESSLALLGSRFDQVDGRVVVRFSLAARAPARLEVMDIAGRRMIARDLSGLEPGEHVLTLDESARLPSGIYLLRIEQTGSLAKGKVAVIR